MKHQYYTKVNIKCQYESFLNPSQSSVVLLEQFAKRFIRSFVALRKTISVCKCRNNRENSLSNANIPEISRETRNIPIL